MRIGYAFHGFLGDYKYENDVEVSSPDGNAAYSWALVWEAIQRGHEVFPLHKDRDTDGWNKHGQNLFGSFSKQKRSEAYKHLTENGKRFNSYIGHPEIDILLVEWRWPIIGKNCEEASEVNSQLVSFGYGNINYVVKPEHQQDLLRQTSLLKHYSDLGIPILLWDLDHKLTHADERKWSPAAIFETSQKPKAQHIIRTSVDFPFVISDLLQHPTLEFDPNRKLVYVGNRYERDDVISKYIGPLPAGVEFWGKWGEADKLWPQVVYHDRIAMRDFRIAYGTAIACPILAKRSYFQTGFMTPRPVEAILFGTIPIGFCEHFGVSKYVSRLADDAHELSDTVEELSMQSWDDRDIEREEAAHKLSFTDARHFVDKIEDVL